MTYPDCSASIGPMSRKKIEENKYELGYLASPLLTVEEANKLAEEMKVTIQKVGGKVTSDLSPAILPLAYKVAKVVNHKRTTFSESYFGAIQAEMSPSLAEEVQAEIKKIDTVLRFMFVVLDKNAEPLSETKRPVIKVKKDEKIYSDNREADKPEVKVEEEKPAEPINEEEIDKKIDDLVSEEV